MRKPYEIIIRILNLLSFLVFIAMPVSAQNELDSLWIIWEDINKPDSVRANALEDYIYEDYFHSNPDSAIVLANQLNKFSQEVGYKIGMVNSLELLGYISFRTGYYPEAFDFYEKGLKIAETIDYKIGMADILVKIGYIYHDNGELIKGLDSYQKSLKIYEEVGNKEGIAAVYNEFGSIYRDKDEDLKSLAYYLKTIAIHDELNDENIKSAVLLNIGSLYLNQGNFPKALESFKKGLALYEKEEDKLGIASGLDGIGEVYMEQGENQKALEYFLRSRDISKEIDDIQGLAHSLLNIGDIYYEEEKYSSSIENCKSALILAQDLDKLGTQMSAYDCLYYSYKATGQVKKALVNLEMMLTLSDSLQTEVIAEKLLQMEFSKQLLSDSLFRVKKEEQLKMAYQAEVKQNEYVRNIAIGSGLFFLIIAGGFFNRWQFVKKSKALLQKEKNRSENLLLNILPYEVAEELKEKGEATARDFELVSILFTDFKGYTEKSENLTAKELVGEIDFCFKAFDYICEKYGIEKIKTIGDAYMAAGGLPKPSENAVQNTVLAALEMQSFIIKRTKNKLDNKEIPFEMRLGIHTGPVVAGIVGVKKFQYDVWGDTVNTAARMETSGAINKVNISQQTYELIKEYPQFTFEPRGKIVAKGKGAIEMWFVEKVDS